MSVSVLKSWNESPYINNQYGHSLTVNNEKVSWGYSIRFSSFIYFISKWRQSKCMKCPKNHTLQSPAFFLVLIDVRVKEIIPLLQPVAPRSLGTSNQMFSCPPAVIGKHFQTENEHHACHRWAVPSFQRRGGQQALLCVLILLSSAHSCGRLDLCARQALEETCFHSISLLVFSWGQSWLRTIGDCPMASRVTRLLSYFTTGRSARVASSYKLSICWPARS